MCKITASKLDQRAYAYDTLKSEMANRAASNTKPRNFVAASVPHLDWHCIPKSLKTGTAVGPNIPSGSSASGSQIGGRNVTGPPVEPQKVRRKVQSLVQTDEPTSASLPANITKKPKTESTFQHRHSFNNSCSAEVTPLQRSLASGVGTVFMTLAMNPLDVVKVRLQAQQKLFAKDPGVIRKPRTRQHTDPISEIYRSLNTTSSKTEYAHKTPNPASATKFSGTLDAFRKIIRREGIRRLWSGLPPTLIMRIPANVVYFTVYDGLKSQFGFQSSHPSDLHSVLVTIFASGCARTMSITLVNPLDLVRTKLQSESMSYSDLGRCIRSGVKAEGVFSLWRGLGSTILRDVPFAILYWSSYELMKTQMMKLGNVTEATIAMTFSAGVASGVLSSIVTTPFDVVKTNKQIAIGEAEGALTRQNTLRMMKQIRVQAGFSGLFAGVVPRVAMSAPASAILITCYEVTLSMFRQYNASKLGRLT